jgi:hypothetical protein
MYGVGACNKCDTGITSGFPSSFFSDYFIYLKGVKMEKNNAVVVKGVQASTLSNDEHRGRTSMRGLLKAVTAGANSANWDKDNKLQGGKGLPVIYSTAKNNRLTGLVFLQDNGNPIEVSDSISAQKPKLEFEVVAWDSDETPDIHEQIINVFNGSEKDANGNHFVRVVIDGEIGFNQTAYSKNEKGEYIVNDKGSEDKPFYELAIRSQANPYQLTAMSVKKLIS